MSNIDGAQFRQETPEFWYIYSISDYVCKTQTTNYFVLKWKEMRKWHRRKPVYDLEKSLHYLQYTVCMLVKFILDPRPTIKSKVTYMFAFLPSSASLGCCGLTHFSLLSPNN